MLPKPFISTLPLFAQDGTDPARDALAYKADEHITEWEFDTISVLDLMRPDRCPANVLDEFCDMLAVDRFAGDTERLKRQKLAIAVQGHKLRSSFEKDIKPKIDIFADTDSRIAYEMLGAQFIWINEPGDAPALAEWSLWDDGSLTASGMLWSGGEFEGAVAGITSIDVVKNDLSTEVIAQIVEQISVVTPAYFRLILGYFSSGIFTPYSGGTIH